MKKIIGLILCLILCVGCLSFVGCKEEQENGSTNVSDQKVVMVGDSLYAYWKDTCATDLGLSNVTNLASSGSSALYWSKSNIIERVAKQNPDIILVCLGTNDVIDLNRRGDCAAKGGNDGYEFSLQSVLTSLHNACPNAKIYYQTINLCPESNRWRLRNEINVANHYMRKFCEQNDWVELIETEYAFYDNEDYSVPPSHDYFADTLHFSKKGYDRLKSIIRQALGLEEKTFNFPFGFERTVLLGDSIIDFWETYERHLNGLENMANIGVGGTTADYWLERADYVIGLNPDVLIMNIGTNDVALGWPLDTISRNIEQFFTAIHQAYPNAKLYIITVQICGARWEMRDLMRSLNEQTREFCEQNDWIDYIEAENVMYDNEDYSVPPNSQYFWNDLLHYNENGYVKLAEVIREKLGLSA